MAKKKFYAVRVGRISGIYGTWDECQKQVNGVSGAEYKSFSTLAEAEQYLQMAHDENRKQTSNEEVPVVDLNAQIQEMIANLDKHQVIAFVDGSYDASKEKSAFGAIILTHDGGKDVLYRSFTKEMGADFISARNVSAELEGVKESINWALQYNKKSISIYYDYEGIEKWATGEWTAKNPISKAYVAFIREKSAAIEIIFNKVPAHSGVDLNEEVDKIAKDALLAKGHKTYNDGSVYFVGYGVEEWKTIIQYLNEENISLADSIDPISFTIQQIETRNKIRVTQGSNSVVINCYRNAKSYVQGKQTVLFQKIVASAIAVLGDLETVVETLNNYHALTLTQNEVETKFEDLLPNYRHTSKKHYANLLSAVYNTMLTGYMPDYTCLVTPIFRAFEFYLHRILGDLMGLPTENNNGSNMFSYFNRNSSGLYECTNLKKNTLSPQQLNYLNRLYTKYNSVRHPYSHWSAYDFDTAVITDITEARNLLLDGLTLVDEYYRIF